MKTRTIKLMLMATALFSVALIASCSSDDDKPKPAENREELAASITDADLLIATTEEGTVEDQFEVGSQATLQEAIDAASDVFLNANSTQKQVNAANANLQTAIDVYMGKKVAPIAAADLIGRWKFDEGTGLVAMDDSPNGFDGTFKTGAASWGAGFPTWTTDRHGNVGKAIAFDDGANIEIPYNSKLNPTAMTISVWVNAAEVRADNRFMGLQSWIGYKFQLQSENSPFFTAGHSGGAYDKSAETTLPINEWYHLVVTFGDGKTIFYINGDMAKTWTDTPNPMISIAAKPYNLVFGQDFPTDKYSAGDGANFGTVGHADYQVIPLAWGGYFHGSIDDIRIYKTPLTAGQVTSIYNNEKP